MIYWVCIYRHGIQVASVRKDVVGHHGGELYNLNKFGKGAAKHLVARSTLMTPVYNSYMHALSRLSDHIADDWKGCNFEQYVGVKN